MKKRSIAQIIIQPLFILICIALSACITLYITQINRIDRYVNGDLNKRIVYAASIFGDMQNHLEVVSAELRSSRSDDLRVAIAKDDVDKIDEEVTQVVQLCNLDGYVVVDLDGNIKTSSYSKVAETEINTIALTVKNSGKEIGFGTFIDGKICEYLAQTFYSEEGDATSVVFLVGQIVSKYETLEALKSKVGLDIYVMDNKQCLATSDTTVSIANVHLLQEAIDSCLIGKTIWSGNATFLGEQTHMSCMPFYDIFGNVIGVGMMRYRETITTEVRSALKTFAIVFVLVVVFTCFMMSWSVRYRIAIPIDVLIEKMSQLAKGDLTVHIEPFNTSNEIDKLTNDLNIMKRKINDVLQPVVETTNIINQTVSDVTKVSNSISDSANSQAASLQEISSSMEEMGANIQQNTDNAIQTNKLSEDVNGQIDALQTSSSKSYEAIRSIANNIEGINELVMQTNILALNASVEAARAGEQGKGFAVVAKEVGRLAEQTHSTADDINAVATSSISEAEDAYNCVGQLLPKIENITKLIKEITTASIEQNAGVSQVNTAISDLNKVTQETAAAAEMMAENAQIVQRQLQDVQKAVSIFKVKRS